MAVAMTPTLQALGWCGSDLGLVGAYTLALRFRVSRDGWLAFLGANAVYIAMASSLGVPGLLVQQIGFAGSSAIGIYRYLISTADDRLEAACNQALCSSLHSLPVSIRNSTAACQITSPTSPDGRDICTATRATRLSCERSAKSSPTLTPRLVRQHHTAVRLIETVHLRLTE